MWRSHGGFPRVGDVLCRQSRSLVASSGARYHVGRLALLERVVSVHWLVELEASLSLTLWVATVLEEALKIRLKGNGGCRWIHASSSA